LTKTKNGTEKPTRHPHLGNAVIVAKPFVLALIVNLDALRWWMYLVHFERNARISPLELAPKRYVRHGDLTALSTTLPNIAQRLALYLRKLSDVIPIDLT
jgi:hypothetical protein